MGNSKKSIANVQTVGSDEPTPSLESLPTERALTLESILREHTDLAESGVVGFDEDIFHSLGQAPCQRPLRNTSFLRPDRALQLESLGAAASLTKDASSIADSLATWGKAVKDSKGTTQLGAMTALVNASATLSKLSTGLGAIGTGLGVISTIISFTQESDTDKILNAINGVMDRMDELEGRMSEEFSQLKSENKLNTSKIQINDQVEILNTVRALVKLYQEKAKTPAERADAVERLLEFKRSDILTAATTIAHNVGGVSSTAVSILEATYNTTYGSLRAVSEIGNTLFAYVKIALIADSLISTLLLEREGPDSLTEEKAQAAANNQDALYGPLLNTVVQATEKYYNKCLSEVSANTRNYAKNEVLPLAKPDDHSATAIGTRVQMSKRYFWLDWDVIIYDPVSGYENHYVHGWNFHTFFRFDPKASGKINAILHWVDKSTPAQGKQWNPNLNNGDPNGPAAGVPAAQLAWHIVPINVPQWASRAFTEIPSLMKQPIKSPGMIFASNRFQGVYFASSNGGRVNWENDKITFGIFI